MCIYKIKDLKKIIAERRKGVKKKKSLFQFLVMGNFFEWLFIDITE